MTVLTDTQVITASGGLVELGYSQIVSGVTINNGTPGTGVEVVAPLTVVCDGSPILVEFFSPEARPYNAANYELNISLFEDGAEKIRSWGRQYNSVAGFDNKPVALSTRLTPSAGSHTYGVKAYVTNTSPSTNTGRVEAGSGTTGSAPAFLRVSKIVQATQWPAVTTGTIICTSSTRPASPFVGQQIYETDTSKSLIYNGTAWVSPQAQTVPPMCVLRNTAVVSIPNTTFTELLYPAAAELVDTDTMHSITTNTGRITINTAGVYCVTSNIIWSGQGAAGSRVLMQIHKNGAEICRADGGNYGATTALGFCLAVTTSCAVNDYLTFPVYQSSGAARNADESGFAAHFIGKTA